MLRVNQIKVKTNANKDDILKKTASVLGIRKQDICTMEIVKQSIDARKKPDIFYSYTVDITLRKELAAKENLICKRCKENQVSTFDKVEYKFPDSGSKKLKYPPVIVGMGPAGLFCGYYLAKHGYKPIILERGKDVDSRTADVNAFWNTGILNTESNVQFGEGGAGTFSDGKLNTLIKDKDGRNLKVLQIFVEHGASERIVYDYKPHIGTDILTNIIKSMRKEIIQWGGQVLFETKMESLLLKDHQVNGVIIQNQSGEKKEIKTNHVVLAIGHSARDTFEILYHQGIPMEAKSFAVGFRVEHPQTMINEAMYGYTEAGDLGAASYKLTAKTSVNRGVYSFCMCPGGYVVNASSENNRLVVNGMSYSDRGSNNANSAIIVSVTPNDFGSEHPLAGVHFQRMLEERAYTAGNGKIPMQYYGEFRQMIDSSYAYDISQSYKITDYPPCTKGSFIQADLTNILPDECNRAFVQGMEFFGKQINGFNNPNTILLGVESRTSSPVRIHRKENLQSEVRGLFPCGEGAGYAGGITSAAMDGMRVAEEIAKEYASFT